MTTANILILKNYFTGDDEGREWQKYYGNLLILV